MNEEESNNSGLYLLFAVLVVILAGVAYARMTAFRDIVDAKAPWFKEKVGHYLVSAKPGETSPGADGDAAATPGASGASAPKGFDLADFATHPESWPKSITIKKETEFPAVLNNKKVGTLKAPVGAEVHLVKIENGKLGVEYQGGGAWVTPEITDLAQRAKAGLASHP
jgi:hypothetical protein